MQRGNTGILSGPPIGASELEALKNIIEERLGIISENDKNNSSLSIEEVEKRIQMAIKTTREEESKRYASGLDSLNSQLIAAKVKINAMEEALTSFELDKSQTKDLELKLEVKDSKITELLDRIKEQELEIVSLNKELEDIKSKFKSEKETTNMTDIKSTMDLMFEKLSNLQITPEVVSKVGGLHNDRPSIEDNKVFIDPTVENDALQSHIDVDVPSIVGSNRNIKSDADKLRALVGSGKYKSDKIK